MMVVVHVLVIFFIWWLLVFRREDRLTAVAMGGLVVFKTIIGFCLSEYYLRHYGGGDMHGYMSDTAVLHDFFLHSPQAFFRLVFLGDVSGEETKAVLSKLMIWYDSGFRSGYNDAQTVTRFHALLSIFIGANSILHLLWSNLLCVFGFRWLIGFFVDESIGRISWWWWLPAFLPNVLLWTSPILKESLLIFIMGALLHTTRMLNRTKSVRNMVLFALSLIAFSLLKYFWLLVLLPGILAMFIFKRQQGNEWKMLLAYVLSFLVVIVAGHIFPSLHLPSLLYGQQLNMWRFAVFQHAGSLIDPVPFAPTDWSLIRHLPFAFVYSLVQPLPAQITAMVMWPMFFESMVVSVLLLIALIVWVRSRKGNAFVACFALIAGAAILVVSGLTTPVLGSLVRYRMPGLLLMVLAAMQIIAGCYRNTPESK